MTYVKKNVLIDLTAQPNVWLYLNVNLGEIMNLQLKQKTLKEQAQNRFNDCVLETLDDRYVSCPTFKKQVDWSIKFWGSICQ